MTAQILTTVQFDDPDTALVKRAGKGDLQAFREIYERHHRRVYGLVLRLAADHDAAQDVTQEVFIQLWKNLERFRGESKFSTWLHTVATRVAITELRKQTKRLNKLQLIGDDQNQYEQQLVQEDSADLGELDTLIKRLPLQMRWVFVLHCIEGMRHEDVADELGIAVGTSKAQVHRARTLLEEWLNYDNA
ncbi:RNA polymerase sigma factor [Pseudidiomarina andamanensis]|uniref:RNA polymerase sigma factor n=1 Tax=Pseudidiomarina andamanensis TaxID=1940690 RepID=UPI00287466A2|nr:sigma-70 family RNA polymerase sigma factor [Pseudidiomarina andamanensis]MDS0218749.1 sigma-70 family RNA polymerase sigma factor [Pseudidiomarina andamanensis]